MKTFKTKEGVTYGVVEVPKEAYDINNSMMPHQIEYTTRIEEGLYKDLQICDCVMIKGYFGKPMSILGEMDRTSDGDIGFETSQLINGSEIIKAVQEQGILFKNPMGSEKPLHIFSDSPDENESKMYQALYKKWLQYQVKVLPLDKKLIILKIE